MQYNMVHIEGFNIEGAFPAFVSPENNHLNLEQTTNFLQQSKTLLQKLLLKHGALVFRGFPVKNAADFSSFIRALMLGGFVNYIGGDSPRDKVTDAVYTSTEAPPAFTIPLHQELSFIKYFPRHIYFYCAVAPQDGGSTTIGDARQIYQALDRPVRERFEEKNLTYTSNYYYDSAIMKMLNRFQRSHKSWKEVFETTDKKDVEKKCQQNEFEWHWHARGWLQIRQTRPAILHHPETRERVWFNQAHLYDFNPRLLGWKNYIGAKLFYFRRSTRLHEISFADRSSVPKSDLYHIMDVLKQNTVAFPWQQNDVMVLDNILAMHGRAPFQGARKILAAMTT
jgi:alpha-ketoglutarate-dependent taurine dioxygenase